MTFARSATTAAATGTVYDHGAHVVEWTPEGHRPVLWMSAASMLETGRPIRGGVPICFPWFGAGPDGDRAPAHGFARITAWDLVSHISTGAGTDLEFLLCSPGTPEFPHPLEARYRMHLGSRLRLALEVTNTGTERLTYEAALHTYLAVSDIRGVTVSGLAGAEYLDKAPGAAGSRNVQVGDITFIGETDRVYTSAADVVITDPGLGRRVTVRKSGSANTVVWNPWIDKAAAMPDFGDDEWPGMLCVEGANVLDRSVTLAPGTSHTMGYTLIVEHLG